MNNGNGRKLIDINLSQIVFDETIYPRKAHSPAKVQEYAENMDAIESLENFIVISLNNKLLDGKHRWLAYQKLADGQDRPIKAYQYPVSETKDEYVKSIELNSTHGQQLSPEEKRQNCQTLYSKYGYSLDTICKIVNVSKSNAVAATKSIRDEERKREDEKIFNMWMTCSTLEEIAETFDFDKTTAKRRVESLLQKVPEYFLQQTFEQDSAFKPPLYNVWTFAKKSNEVGHFGNSEQQILDNLLYLYTEPYDIVVDPFAGGGSTIDVCKKRIRRVWASDRKPIVERASEIRLLDIGKVLPPLDNRWSDVALTYLDPPYWKQAEGQYSSDPEDLANMSLDKFTDTLVGVVNRIAEKQSRGIIAMLIQPTQWKADNRDFTDHVFDVMRQVNPLRLRLENRVSCPYSTEQYNAQQVEWAKANKKLLVISRELIIWRLI